MFTEEIREVEAVYRLVYRASYKALYRVLCGPVYRGILGNKQTITLWLPMLKQYTYKQI